MTGARRTGPPADRSGGGPDGRNAERVGQTERIAGPVATGDE
ncbi:hypothetical protein [Micromonospora sp. HM134]|nr:hypothetical protein [Micromonospora sp. HM134]